ncbi:hypothetical protein ZTR_10650 [Talaromyces verruculosus]|nr:hypothetical protein ZTR_10650 [Talaromyces verruculosus]
MVLELHVWGPGFFLPSIDAQCLATIAYFVKTVPKDKWVLVASSDPSVSPSNELPAVKDGQTWVSKFRNIVDYVRQYSNEEWDLDADWEGLDKADITAFSAFLESNGQLLLDLSLYVSSQNYYAATSPAYGSILTWPNQWILPPKLRNAAKHRTEHLGLSSLDLEATEEQQRERERAATGVSAGQIPASLITRPRETVSTLLGKTAQYSQFRLDGLTAELFEPLEQLLGAKKYLLADGQRPSSLDMLVLGYLSLVLFPEVPSKWLRESLTTKTPRLAKYVERMRDECFGGVVRLEEAFPDTAEIKIKSFLPWRQPERTNAVKIGSTLLNTLADATPIWKDFRMNSRLQQSAKSMGSSKEEFDSKNAEAVSVYANAQRRDLYISIASVAAGLAAMVGYLTYNGLIDFGSEDDYEEEQEEEVVYEPESLGTISAPTVQSLFG